MKRTFTLALLAAASSAGVAHGQSAIAIGGGIGTTGGVAEIQAQIQPWLQLRGGYNYFEYEADDTYDDIAYTGDLDLTTLGAFVDLHPFSNSFVISAGAYFGDKGLNLAATPGQSYEIDGQIYTPAQVGVLALSAALEETAPFLGLGWDTTFQGDGPFGFKFLAGAMFTGSPAIDLTSTGGTQSGNAAFQQALANEEVALQDEVNDYEVYPVVQAGVTFRF